MYGRDCLDLLHKGYTEDGVYYINPDGNGFTMVLCDQKTNGGGWTVFQQRIDGSVNFYLNWNSYKDGFGTLTKEFWLGNNDLHRITSRGSQLLIELEHHNSQTRHASYESFYVGTEAEKFTLQISSFSGTPGDSMILNHNGMKFSTYDQDNDVSPYVCAQTFTGAWWYRDCHRANLNGKYGDTDYGKGINWYTWKDYYYSLKKSSMKVKPIRGKINLYVTPLIKTEYFPIFL